VAVEESHSVQDLRDLSILGGGGFDVIIGSKYGLHAFVDHGL